MNYAPILYLLFTFTLPSFLFSQSIGESDLYGRWEVIKILEGSIDISDSQGMDANRWINFNSDNTFQSDGNPFGKMEGVFKLDSENGRVFLTRNDFNKSQSIWKVQFKGYDLVFTGFGKAARFEIYLNSGF